MVGSDIPGLGDMLENEKIGRSIAMGDSLSLAQAIISFLDNPNALMDAGKRARVFAVHNYSWESIVSRLEANIFTLVEFQNR